MLALLVNALETLPASTDPVTAGIPFVNAQRVCTMAAVAFDSLEYAHQLEAADIKAKEKLLTLHSAGLGHEKVP